MQFYSCNVYSKMQAIWRIHVVRRDTVKGVYTIQALEQMIHGKSREKVIRCKFAHQIHLVQYCGKQKMCVPGLRIDPLRLLAGCRKRRLNQAPLNLRGLI